MPRLFPPSNHLQASRWLNPEASREGSRLVWSRRASLPGHGMVPSLIPETLHTL